MKYFIKTYGCQMNLNDSERISGLLEYAGFEQLNAIDVTDAKNKKYNDLGIVLVNTCSVRDAAENKGVGFLSQLRPFKEHNKKLIVGLCGCVAGYKAEEIKKRFPFVDIIFGPSDVAKLSELLKLKDNGHQPKRGKGPTAWINIMEGCDNFCSYCIVPYARGREKSRTVKDILSEIRQLDKSVYKEVVLLGQNVNSYRDARCEMGEANSHRASHLASPVFDLAELLKKVNIIEGIERIRFLTSHPKDMNIDIIRAVNELPKVCEYFHLPLQSGNDRILKLMNRGYTAEDYRKLVKMIRKEIPDAAITSDAIVGFPGETDAEFKDTCKLLKELELDAVNTFSYSGRAGTPAAKMDGHVPEKEKKERLSGLMRAVESSALKRNNGLIGKTMEVMVERSGSGRTRGNKLVHFRSKTPKPGDTIYVRMNKAEAWALEGSIVP
jgi:tRNA-2-methylthio-N6-dimethylallyladenosine synthase